MFCRKALVTEAVTAGPDQTIGDALQLMERYGVRMLPITTQPENSRDSSASESYCPTCSRDR